MFYKSRRHRVHRTENGLKAMIACVMSQHETKFFTIYRRCVNWLDEEQEVLKSRPLSNHLMHILSFFFFSKTKTVLLNFYVSPQPRFSIFISRKGGRDVTPSRVWHSARWLKCSLTLLRPGDEICRAPLLRPHGDAFDVWRRRWTNRAATTWPRLRRTIWNTSPLLCQVKETVCVKVIVVRMHKQTALCCRNEKSLTPLNW